MKRIIPIVIFLDSFTPAYGADSNPGNDVLPSKLLNPAIFLMTLLLAFILVLLPQERDRLKRSLTLLILLNSLLGVLANFLPLYPGAALSLLIFLGTIAVIHLLGRFESP